MIATGHAPLLLVYGPEYLDALRGFPADHPLRPIRGELAVGLMRAYGLLDGPEVVMRPPRMATDDELERVHAPEYMARVRELGLLAEARGTGAELRDRAFGLVPPDNPIFPSLHDGAALGAGGTLLAAEAVMAGSAAHAFVPLGGLHHAMRARANGFCVYNDLAVAIAAVLARHPDARVAYVDIDAHHGDGVQALFWDDPRVLAISLHESGAYLFPGTGYVEDMGGGAGYGYSVNVPLEPFTSDETITRAFAAVVPPLLRAFRPHLIVAQLGCDTHWTDPLTELGATTNLFPPLVTTLHDLAHELCEGRLVATGGGGYQTFSVVPRAWTLDVAALLGRELPDELPDAWLAAAAGLTDTALPSRLSDRPAPALSTPRQVAIDGAADTVIAYIQKEIFPLHGLVDGRV